MAEPESPGSQFGGSDLPIPPHPSPTEVGEEIPLTTYKMWAASRSVTYVDRIVAGQRMSSPQKTCPFCDKAIGCPTGDQSLIQHMKSSVCREEQHKLGFNVELNGTTLSATTSASNSSDSLALSDDPSKPALPRCEGVMISTTANIFSSYPWHQHDPDHTLFQHVAFQPERIYGSGQALQLRSRCCTGYATQLANTCCEVCARLPESKEVQSMIDRIETEEPQNGLNRKYYSFRQMSNLVEEKDEIIKKTSPPGRSDLESRRKARRLLGKLDDHKQLVLALSESDRDTLGRLFQVALRQGCGVKAIVDRVRGARDGLYSCQSYLDESIDSGLLVYRLGGPRLLYALSESHDLPSASTIKRRTERSYMRPSTSFPTRDELLFNIKNAFQPALNARSSPRGHTLMIDEMAVEERVQYCFAEDALLGFCREHSDPHEIQNMTGRPIEHLYKLKEDLKSGQLHRAKEATVVAIAAFGASNYAPKSVLVSGTCKAESPEQQRELISLVIRAWSDSPYGQSENGSLWSIATDGDPRRRQAIHSLCTLHILSPTSPLFPHLGSLALLNLSCGENEIVHDSDFKHLEKRLASALRSGTGLYILGTHISQALIKSHLRKLSNLTNDRLNSLFDNTDRQDVPKAQALLQAIYEASQLPEVRSDISSQPFVLLAEFLHSFYAPHTTPSMSLSEQITSLARSAFLLFAIFQIDGSSFTSTQLFYDIQLSVKNVYFCVAKTKVLDPSLPFYLLQSGDDRLEGQFGIYRTMHTNHNPDILQLAEQSGAVQDVANIFARHPGWDRKPYRISLNGTDGIDHLNPAGWIGDVCVGNVDLAGCWFRGQEEAATILQTAGAIFDFNPETLQARYEAQDVDLMRPYGLYVGVTELVPDATQLDPFISVSALESCVAADTNDCLSIPELEEQLLDATVTSPDNNIPVDPELPLEFHLPPSMPAPEDDIVSIPDTEPLKRGWVRFGTRIIHYESAVRIIFTLEKEKLGDRLRRVQGQSKYPSIGSPSDSILGDFCLIGQIVAALVWVGKEVALAAVRLTLIQVGKSQVESISIDHMSRSDVVLSGQILQLDFDGDVWYWNRCFVEAVARGSLNSNGTKPLLAKFSASLVELVNPVLCKRNGKLFWSFPHGELSAMLDVLWSKGESMTESRHAIPVCEVSGNFPYQTETKDNRLVHQDASQAIEGVPTEECGPCFLCGQIVSIRHYMRTHVGKHLAAKYLGYPDPLQNTEIASQPCGYCGRSGYCKTTVTTNRKGSSRIRSTCVWFDKKSYYKTLETTTTDSPCTNRPISCTYPQCIGQDAIWSYNMQDHIREVHGVAAYNSAVQTDSFSISTKERDNLKLDNMLLIPGRKRIVLQSTPSATLKRLDYDDRASTSAVPYQIVPKQIGAGSSGASSQAKRPRLK